MYDNVVVHYEIGKWVYPKLQETKLFAFVNLESAIGFYSYSDDKRIFECEMLHATTKGVQPSLLYCLNHIEYSEILKAWSKSTRIKAPKYPGTIFASAIKLIKEIKIT
jgi:hypothetical protein